MNEAPDIADLLHDLRNHLAVIKTEFEVCLKRTRSPKDYQLALENSLREVEKIELLLQQANHYR